ncbi:MAG: twin-arginine translocation pathway signal protein [Pusillimonas sp.]|nr:twin-arginine translocation pathway signal protein [Pusillimonas sp.]MBC41897.1 twin-arginine translocation pathway signal protein [Pusillimonas sp.]|tara:strand:- start:8248 stop:8829 length:582 start_codon:yes stop_codon:yes gene_type:complete
MPPRHFLKSPARALSRRTFLRRAGALSLLGAAPAIASPALAGIRVYEREIALDHTHTLEKVQLVYALNDDYIPPALRQLNVFLRDHYSGAIGSMDPALYDQLNQIRTLLNTKDSFEVISGYRDPKTNEHLRKTRGGGVAKNSLHMYGKAIDVRLPGVPLAELRDAAISLNAGGVGYYPTEQFLHVDTGKVRTW